MNDPLFRSGLRSPPALKKLLGRLVSWLIERPLTWPTWAQGTWARLTGTPAADAARHAPFTLGQLFKDTLPVRPPRPARAGLGPQRRHRTWSAAARLPASACCAPAPGGPPLDSTGTPAVRRRTRPRRYHH